VTGTKPLQVQPDLAQRVRGALGNALETLCQMPPARLDPFDRASAHDLLYFWTSPQVDTCFETTEVAVPMVIRADIIGNAVTIIVRLFGQARVHHPIVEAAAIMALNGGVSLRNHGIRVAFPVQHVEWSCFDGANYDWPEQASSVLLRYRTPVIIRAGKELRLEPEAVMRSAMRRVVALVPWMGFSLDANAGALETCIDRLNYELDIHPEHWTRYTSRARDEAIEVYGFGGSMRVNGALDLVLPYLAIAHFSSLGGECASGFGAIEIVPCV
jgi:CRISPR-associated endoribonuclease Cas6